MATPMKPTLISSPRHSLPAHRQYSSDAFSQSRETQSFPRSPDSISTESSHRGSGPLPSDPPSHHSGSLSARGRSVSDHSLKSSEPDTPGPNSPPMRMTRKRAASLITDRQEEDHPRLQDLGLHSARLPPTPVREQVCLCQPDPKIPRPRNAFILYRQHYQASVVAAHPGLANPDISKIIGEQWREQPLEVKTEWKRLAEEEKQRHAKQYPEYRYQPRRAGKPHGARSAPPGSSDESGRCPKCGGRYISTPSTPMTPFTPGYSLSGARELTHMPQPSNMDPLRYAVSPPRGYQSQQSYPHHPQPNNPHYRGQWVSGQPPGSAPLITSREHEYDEREAEYKRRRANHPQSARAGYFTGPTAAYGEHMQHRDPRDSGPLGWSHDARAQGNRPNMPLPSPGQLMHPQHDGSMEPPPRPGMHAPYAGGPPHPQAQAHARSLSQHQAQGQSHPQTPSSALPVQYGPPQGPTFDPALRLPPLQTALGTAGKTAHASERPSVSRHESYARTVEAMVMTIPYINKIKVFSKIAPPLATPSAGSPIPEIRGIVIAVEGRNTKAVAEVGRYIEGVLAKERELDLQTWIGERRRGSDAIRSAERTDSKNTDVKMGGLSPVNEGRNDSVTRTNSLTGSDSGMGSFAEYLSVIQEWHQKSAEIVRHITTVPSHRMTSISSMSMSRSSAMLPVPNAGSVIKQSGDLRATSTSSTSPPALVPSPLITPPLTGPVGGEKLPGPASLAIIQPLPHLPLPGIAPMTSHLRTTSSESIASITSISSTSTSNSAARSHPKSADTTIPSSSTRPSLSAPRTPIALLPAGFSLSTSDTYASRIPINDAYAPVDHWQWTATLWRGIVGADLVIYVDAGGIGGSDGGDSMSGSELRGVEVRSDCSAIVLHGLEEKTMRRAGFEVLEWIRGYAAEGATR